MSHEFALRWLRAVSPEMANHLAEVNQLMPVLALAWRDNLCLQSKETVQKVTVRDNKEKHFPEVLSCI